jgi:hypothetical protein
MKRERGFSIMQRKNLDELILFFSEKKRNVWVACSKDEKCDWLSGQQSHGAVMIPNFLRKLRICYVLSFSALFKFDFLRFSARLMKEVPGISSLLVEEWIPGQVEGPELDLFQFL